MRVRPTRLKSDLSSSDYWALMRPWSSTYTTVWKGIDSFPPLLVRMFASHSRNRLGGTLFTSVSALRPPFYSVEQIERQVVDDPDLVHHYCSQGQNSHVGDLVRCPFFQLRGIFLGSPLPRFFPGQREEFLCTAIITVPRCTL